ncbi:hypothetical protein BC936DRAFT_150135 [Jimgerdemannia flammicorona]|uniref:Uncharacterized protein n=1 Tax=Jimgerdemannia flammicorona TaxID=994334 RepID=A0A433CZF9_9FUNG|nr:hypothetical protein BC936DRAFT_150135 [Jimgerdemannia flammicorona]
MSIVKSMNAQKMKNRTAHKHLLESNSTFKEDNLMSSFSSALSPELAAALFPNADIAKKPMYIVYRQKGNISQSSRRSTRPTSARRVPKKSKHSQFPVLALSPNSSTTSSATLDSLLAELDTKSEDQRGKEAHDQQCTSESNTLLQLDAGLVRQ